MSASEAKRVALLARAGQAREQLRIALHEAGADIVLEDDPGAIDAQILGDAAPQVVLVALEPAIEDSLTRLEAVLDDPAVAVIFDEAELAARRQGWEAQRWARHLSAKIHGHGDVLPPGREEDVGLSLEPGLPPTPAQIHAEAGFGPHLHEAVDLAWELPSDDFAFTPSATPDAPLVDADQWLQSAASVPQAQTPPSPPPLPAAQVPEEVAAPAASKWNLELEPLEHAATHASGTRASGAVMVFAGIGGPDAVRKLLGELPGDFVRPVVVHLKLDGGRYDNLVRQMARVSPMPVMLAEPGHTAEPGHVYVLPGDVSMSVATGAISFRQGRDLEAAIDQLPAKDSAVLLLSGSDADWVEHAMPLSMQGALVIGQAPEGCYDPTASHALSVRGGAVAAPAQMARQLIERWDA